MDEKNYLAHVGRSKRNGAPGPGSGRYPLGSGDEPYQDYSKGQLQRMAKSYDKDDTKKELASKIKKSSKKSSQKSLSSIARKKAEEFRKSRYKKKMDKEKEEAKKYKERIRLEKTRLDKEKAKEEAKRLSKMSGKEYSKKEESSNNEPDWGKIWDGDVPFNNAQKNKSEEKNYSLKAKPVSEMSNQDIQNYLNRVKLERDYNSIVNQKHKSAGRKMVEDILMQQGRQLSQDLAKMVGNKIKKSIENELFKNEEHKKYGPSNKKLSEMSDKDLKDDIARRNLELQLDKLRHPEKHKDKDKDKNKDKK